MKRVFPIAMVLLLGPYAWTSSKTITTTGFFADEGCARGRANSGIYTNNNPECARQCLEKGSLLVFIDERGKTLYAVKDYKGAIGDLGYRLEVTGALDDAAKTLTIDSVKRLEPVPASCSRSKASSRQSEVNR